jgi:hypothetical protein
VGSVYLPILAPLLAQRELIAVPTYDSPAHFLSAADVRQSPRGHQQREGAALRDAEIVAVAFDTCDAG